MKNLLFPGRQDYQGPTQGVFGLLHHEILSESSHYVMERVGYVKHAKPKKEIAIRLHNMIYLGDCPAALKRAAQDADYEAKRAAQDADYEANCATLYADYEANCATLYADYEAKCAPFDADYEANCATLDAEILAFIKLHIPDCAWNGTSLTF
jgi:hypothetical protein